VGTTIDQKLVTIKGNSFLEYRNKFEKARDSYVRGEYPLEISFDTVSYCNLMCKMCYRSFLSNTKHENMPMEIVDKLVKQIKEFRIPSVRFAAQTESLLHPDISIILKKITGCDLLDCWIITNGVFLSEYIREIIIDIPVTVLSVSLDAATPKTYKNIRGGGGLEKVKDNIMNFLSLRQKRNSPLPLLRVTFVEQADNKHETNLFLDSWKDIADIVDIQTFKDYSILKDTPSKPNNKSFKCFDPFFRMVVNYDGQLFPCCPGPIYYKSINPVFIQNVDIKSYWQSEELLSLTQSIRDKKYPECCKRCLNVMDI
jgi:MoaA/NifB/PqqE/SkfB family radical SAM enzyme